MASIRSVVGHGHPIPDPLLDHGDLGLEAPRQLANDLGCELRMGEFIVSQ
jgi:hypothetical protein